MACSVTKDPAEIKVIAGETVSESEFRWVVPITIDVNESSEAHCTGTVISSDSVLTAAHCIVGNVSVFYEGRRFNPKQVIMHPEFLNATSLQSKKMNDVAIMKFDGDVFAQYPLQWEHTPEITSNEISFFGYGHLSYENTVNVWVFLASYQNGEVVDINEDGEISSLDMVSQYILNPKSTEGDGGLRQGYNRIESRSDSLMTVRGSIGPSHSRHTSSAAPGDSGGPVISRTTSELIGIVQGGSLITEDIDLETCRFIQLIEKNAYQGIFPDKKPKYENYSWYHCPDIRIKEKESYFLDLTSPRIQKFIAGQLHSL